MPFTLRQVRRAFTGKFGFDLEEGRTHPTFILRDAGRIVAKTHISHGSGRDVTEGVISAMARQLGVPAPRLRDGIDCALSGDAFVRLVRLGERRM